MVREAISVDVNHSPELLALSQEVKRTRTARALCVDGVELARIVPPPAPKRSRKGRPTSEADSIWNIVGIASSDDASDASECVDESLADWEISRQRR